MKTEYTKCLGFKITEKEKATPIMYWIPKMHKNQTGARFIIASETCSTKQISKSASNVFKLAPKLNIFIKMLISNNNT